MQIVDSVKQGICLRNWLLVLSVQGEVGNSSGPSRIPPRIPISQLNFLPQSLAVHDTTIAAPLSHNIHTATLHYIEKSRVHCHITLPFSACRELVGHSTQASNFADQLAPTPPLSRQLETTIAAFPSYSSRASVSLYASASESAAQVQPQRPRDCHSLYTRSQPQRPFESFKDSIHASYSI